MTTKEYQESGKHLPDFMRDFHDCKDVFKAMHAMYAHGEQGKPEHERMPNFRSGMCYTVDWFLWFMALHGWTLQRSRADVDFRDIHATVEEDRKASTEAFRSALAQGLNGRAK